ncbi:N-acetylaspartate synthetase isoform X2 [Myxocyprinus asiaticus]|uniref:N-acetylaspartate synthetase isoform X2 n=1 Tax=Myxocyprinus asiaticus TaxID=70543 RepID=UPI002223AB6F|nr:N-acetylaspartate synthetase isoform X2 [Myxocyprinus asiaticus]
MHCSSAKMVCETKIVADEHDAIPGTKKDSIIVSSSQMWTSSSSSPSAHESKDEKRNRVFIREFEHSDREEVRRIFNEGIMERIPNSAFRGLKQQTRTQFIYAFLTGSCFWVAVLQGQVVGIVAAQGREDDNTVELRRMSVDSRFRGKGIAKALGRRVLEFAMLNNYSSVVLGTTAVKMAAHKLYESLGFRRVGETEDYILPGMTRSPLERLFFQIRYSRYRLQLHEE